MHFENDDVTEADSQIELMRSLRTMEELMAEEPEFPRSPWEVRSYTSHPAFRIDGVLISFRKAKRDFASMGRRMNVTGHAVKVNLAGIMIDNQTAVPWNFDVTIEINICG